MMKEIIVERNMVRITGKIVSEFRQVHGRYGKGLYTVVILTARTSGVTDRIPLIVPARLVHMGDYTGYRISVEGQFRSYNRREEGRTRLKLSVFVREFRFLEEGELTEREDSNRVFLDGYICRLPVYRKTPLGKEITEMLLAVNRAHGKSDYIPCIAWGKDARDVAKLDVGAAVRVLGRIQSREYEKRLPQEGSETRVAYEVSVMEVEAGDRMMHGEETRTFAWKSAEEGQ